MDVCSVCGRGVQKRHGRVGSFREIVEVLLARCTREELTLAVLVAKKIWARQNVVVHRGDFQHPNRIVREAKELRKSMQVMPEEHDAEGGRARMGGLQINWDVAIDIQLNCMGFGVIIRDHNGVVCAAKSVKICRAFDAVIGEAMAATVAMEFSKEREIQDVILEGDSMQVVQALQDRNPSWRTYGHIIDDTRVLLGTCRSWTVHHVKENISHYVQS